MINSDKRIQAVINEQVRAKLLNREVGSYIYEACKEQAQKLGWLEED